MRRVLIVSALLGIGAVPLFALAQGLGQIVPCDFCRLCDLETLVQRLLNWATYFAVFFATIAFVYAGFLYATGSANPEQIGRAHKIFWNVLIGIIFILGAWLIVDTILKALLNEQKYGPWNKIQCPASLEAQETSSSFFERKPSGGAIEAVPAPSTPESVPSEEDFFF